MCQTYSAGFLSTKDLFEAGKAENIICSNDDQTRLDCVCALIWAHPCVSDLESDEPDGHKETRCPLSLKSSTTNDVMVQKLKELYISLRVLSLV